MKKMVILLFCSLQWSVLAQELVLKADFLKAKYEGYFKTDRQTVHLHLNKNVFFAGEHIWFSTYLYNQAVNLPSKEKHFIYIDLITPKGEVLAHKTILYDEGFRNSEFFLPDTLKPGLYFLQAYTANMQNFEEDDSSVYPVLIHNLNRGEQGYFDYLKKQKELSMAIKPENGALIANVFTNCVARATDSLGRGFVPDSALLLHSKTQKIKKLIFDQHGMSLFSLKPQYGLNYSIHYFYQGRHYKKDLAAVQKTGVSLSLSRNHKRAQMIITINDTRSLDKKNAAEPLLFLHKDNRIINIPLKQNPKTQKHQITLDYQVLNQGINTLSLLDPNGAVYAQRHFYQQTKGFRNRASILNGVKKGDSLGIILKQNLKDSLQIQYSISVLPLETRAHKFRKNAFFSLYLQSYFKGPQWQDFWTINIKKPKDLILLDKLCFFAKNKYNWKDIVNPNLSIPKTNANKLSIAGSIEIKDQKKVPKHVLLYSKENQIIQTTDLVNNHFLFSDLVIAKGSKLNLSVVDQKGKPQKTNFSYTLQPSLKNFRHRFTTTNNYLAVDNTKKPTEQSLPNPATQALKEVTVTGNKLQYQKFFPSYYGVKAATVSGINTLKEFIIRAGFSPTLINPNFNDYRRAGSVQLAKKSIRNGYIFPAIIFDGSFSAYTDIYEQTRMEYIDEIYTDKRADGSLLLVVLTNTKFKQRALTNRKITSKEITSTLGFEHPKPFKKPDYFNTDQQAFLHFGIIDWQARTSAAGKTKLYLNPIPKNQKAVRVCIEGLTTSGTVISENQLLPIN